MRRQGVQAKYFVETSNLCVCELVLGMSEAGESVCTLAHEISERSLRLSLYQYILTK